MEASVKQGDGKVWVSLLHTLAHETGNSAGTVRIRIQDSLLRVSRAECFPRGRVNLEREGGETLVQAEELPEFSIITLMGEDA